MVEGKPDNKDHLKEQLNATGEEPAGSPPPGREAQYIEETEQVGRDVDQASADQASVDQDAVDQANEAAVAAAVAEPAEPEDAAPAAAKAAAEKAAVEKSAADKVAEPAAPRGASPILPLLSGAVGAALVLGGAWFAVGQNLPLTPQSGDSAALESLTARLASVEAKANAGAAVPSAASAAAPVAAEPDPALIKRIDNLEKSLTALHDELAATKEKTVQLSAAIGNLKPAAATDAAPAEPSAADSAAPATPSTPAVSAAELAELGERLTKLQAAVAALPPPVDLTPVNERLSKLEVAVDKPPPVLDDSGLRRVVAAALLESAVQHGEAYAGLLGTAKSLAPDPAALQPLEPFAANGVPSAKDLCRELIALLPKLIPGYDPLDSTASILDRLQAGADRLVRIQRPGTPGTKDRSAVLARMITAAQRNDLAEAKRELSMLEPSERAPAQEWLNRANARDAALSASRQFAAAAMAALSK